MTTLLAAMVIVTAGYSQSIEKNLQPFEKIVVSPKIDLVLIPGNTESIRITYDGVEQEKIIIKQSGKKVHVYLDGAKIFDKGERGRDMFEWRPAYRFARVTAYVTFKSLRLIETRGDGEVLCEGKILSRNLKVRAYGDVDVLLAYVEAKTFRARMFGDNYLNVHEGLTGHSNYRLYGDNRVDADGIQTVTSNSTIYGAGQVKLFATEEVRVNAFGDQRILISGSPNISRGVVFGSAIIKRN